MHRSLVGAVIGLTVVGLLSCGVSSQEEAQLSSQAEPRTQSLREWETVSPTESSSGEIDLKPNVIKATATLTNQNPEILSLLSKDPWHTYGKASAFTTNGPFYQASTTSLTFNSPTQFTFEMLVEAAAGGEAGVVYSLEAFRGDSPLTRVNGVRVKPRNIQPYPTEVELQDCLGVIQIFLAKDESCQAPAPGVWSASLGEYLSSLAPPSYYDSSQNLLTAYIPAGSSQTTMKTRVLYKVASPIGSVSGLTSVEWNNLQCDQVIRLCAVARPPVVQTGELTGPYDVLGESPTYNRYVQAAFGPNGYTNNQSISGNDLAAPIHEPGKWWRIPDLLAGNYSLWARTYLRRGRQFTFIDPPPLKPDSPTRSALVETGKSNSLARVINGEVRYPFVMKPAFFYGTVQLADPFVPHHPGATSTLQNLYFNADYDSDGDGIPNHWNHEQTEVYAGGDNGSSSRTSFPGQFVPGTGELASTYEQVLPGTYDLPHYWWNSLKLRFWSEGESTNSRPGLYDREKFRSGSLSIDTRNGFGVTLNPRDRYRIDHAYCFNELKLLYRTDLGRFINPKVNIAGGYKGLDWRQQQVDYRANGSFTGDPYVMGYPVRASDPSALSYLHMTLPQGTFTLTPRATMVSDSGTTNEATFAPLSLTTGCGQRLNIVPPLVVLIDPINQCVPGGTVRITGKVLSRPAIVDRIFYRLNGGTEVTLCTNCGQDPTFSFNATLQSCENTVQVFAENSGLPEPATGSQQLVWDDPTDGPSCANTSCLNRPPVARCRNIEVPSGDSCTQGCGSVDDGSYDPDLGDTFSCTQDPGCPYMAGTRNVTLTCRDRAGNTSSCNATVTVRDMQPPIILCPAAPVLACVNGGAKLGAAPSAWDACGAVSTLCSPASGVFPMGTTPTTCTATDMAGNRASCSFNVTVRDEEPPQLTCPAPITRECGPSTSLPIPEATASDTCELKSLQSPSVSSFPLGTTPLTYTATDAAGLVSTCTTSVTVQDTQPPVLQLLGDTSITLGCGVDTYTEPGFIASDACSGSLTSQVQVSGTINPEVPGHYTLIYSVTDSAGQKATATRVIDVVKGEDACCLPNTGHFTATASGTSALHLQHTATPLPDGRVLVVGGFSRTPELYDGAPGTWTSTSASLTTHRLHTATLLTDGRVLVAGGNGASPSNSAEVYNPHSGTWSATGNLVTYRRQHVAVRLVDGRVLVMGGTNASGAQLSSAELYDPTTGLWSSTSSMAHARRAFTATLLQDGRVLVAGGLTDGGDECTGTNCLGAAEVYEPFSGTWSTTGEMVQHRGFHSAVQLADGRVLVSGGVQDGPASTSAEVYDPATGMWTNTGEMGAARRRHSLTPLPNGQVLAVGGYDSKKGIHASAELYTPEAGTWCPTGPMSQPRYSHTATPLPGGRVLITAGYSTASQYTAEVYGW